MDTEYLRNMPSGNLYLIPVPLSGGDVNSLSSQSIEIAHSLTHFVVERAKPARAFLKSIKHPIPLQEIIIHEMPETNDTYFHKMIIREILSGINMGLVSEAGLPCIADPGYEIVSLAHQHKIKVIPFSGPNSMMMALMASGMDGQQFRFHGYLPAKKEMLREQLIKIVSEIKKTGITQIFMETPYRNKQVLEMVKTIIPAELNFCVASSLLSVDQIIMTKRIREWKKDEFIVHFDKPSIFILGR
jgi:16S rRNA (cytidine1402-2'-O)-methyltransferase